MFTQRANRMYKAEHIYNFENCLLLTNSSYENWKTALCEQGAVYNNVFIKQTDATAFLVVMGVIYIEIIINHYILNLRLYVWPQQKTFAR